LDKLSNKAFIYNIKNTDNKISTTLLKKSEIQEALLRNLSDLQDFEKRVLESTDSVESLIKGLKEDGKI